MENIIVFKLLALDMNTWNHLILEEDFGIK